MTLLRPTALRPLLAALLAVVLTLAGVGRGLAQASDVAGPGFGVAGMSFPICHAGDGRGPAPDDGSRHDCCDACALLAPATLAAAPSLSGPGSVAGYVEHARAMGWRPVLARVRTPRQSQGPPDA